MDPLGAAASILQISRTAWKLGSYIYTIYQGTKNIDESVQSLALEVHGLASTCDLVHDELGTVLVKSGSGTVGSQYDRDGRLWRCIDQQVLECENTLQELGKVVETLWPRKETFFERASKQISLQNSREQTDEIRKRIRSHTDALHTILLVVNIRVSHIASDHATQQLPGKLDDLRQRLLSIESKLDGPQRRKDSFGHGDTTLVNFARDTLRSGETLCEASVAGSVIGAETADSVMGGEQAASSNREVAEWVSAVNALRTESRQGYVSDVEPSLLSDDGKDTTATKSTNGCGPLAGPADDLDYDSDDEQVELAQAALDNGNRAFDAEKWVSAARFLHTSLKLLQKLPEKHKKAQGVFELQYRLAVCAYHTGNLDQAEAGLETLSQHTPISNEQGVQLCDARHLLSRIYLERNNLDSAKQACESTLRARSRLLGKEHEARYESMALMARIYQLLDDDVLSELYAFRMPDARRDSMITAVSTLCPAQVLVTEASAPILPIATGLGIPITPASQGRSLQQMEVPLVHQRECDRSVSSLSPDPSPYGVSPKTHECEKLGPLGNGKPPMADQTQLQVDLTEKIQLCPSVVTSSPDLSATTTKPPDTIATPGRPQRWSSAPTIPVSSTRSDRRTCSASTTARSIISLEEPAEESYPPLQVPTPSRGPSGSPEAMSRPNREAIVSRFRIEPMHNLDQAICSGRLDKALVLVKALYSGSTQVGNPDTSIVFNSNGLRSANKSPALHLAVLFGDLSLVKPLMKNGFSPNFSYEPPMQDFPTPLDLAIASRNEPIIRELLANGALLGPAKGLSPCRQLLAPKSLQLWPPSSISEVSSVLDLLLSSNWPRLRMPKHFPANTSPLTPSLLAPSLTLRLPRVPLATLLLQHASTAALSAPASSTPLHYAIHADDPDLINLLLSAQGTFQLRNMTDKRDAQGRKPLYQAVQRAAADPALPTTIVQSLLEHGGADLDDVHTQNEPRRRLRVAKKTYSTARSVAMESGREDLVALVQGYGENGALRLPLVRARTVV